MLLSEGVGLMVWSPLAGGLLSGKYTRGDDGRSAGEGRRAAFDFPPVEMDRAYSLVDAMKAMADAKGASVAQIALAWLLYQPAVSTVIVGAKRADQLAENIGACEVEFTQAEWDELDKLSRLPREYPGWMLGFQGGYRGEKVSPRRSPK
jgi:aryl-alcohol dehydrogenase-like predicted oxidoreductase